MFRENPRAAAVSESESSSPRFCILALTSGVRTEEDGSSGQQQ